MREHLRFRYSNLYGTMQLQCLLRAPGPGRRGTEKNHFSALIVGLTGNRTRVTQRRLPLSHPLRLFKRPLNLC
jgi:hypothetical protein